MSHPRGPDDHPDAERLAAFVDGALRGDELMTLASHLRDCEECREVAGAAAGFETEQAVPAPMGGPSRTALWWGVAAALALVLVGGTFYGRLSDPLRDLQQSRRLTEGRLTSLAYAPYAVTRGSQDEDYKALSAAAKLSDALQHERSVTNLHRLALAQMALGKPAPAAELLHEAAQKAPQDATLLSDLAAAQLASGDAGQAGENAARALQLDASLAPAAFNWALALEKLSNRAAAIKAWEAYLRLDANGGWGAEATEHLRRLRQPMRSWKDDRSLIEPGLDDASAARIAARYPQRVRYLFHDELLPHWLTTRDAAELKTMRTLAAARAKSGDAFLSDVLDRAERGGPDVDEGERKMQQALAFLDRREMDAASAEYSAAAALLHSAGSPLGAAADVFAAMNDFYGGRSEAALARLDQGDLQNPPGRAVGVASEALWVRGLVTARLGDVNASLAAYRRGLALAREGGEVENEIALHALIAEDLDRVGEPEEAERERAESLRKLLEGDAPGERLYTAYADGAYAALRAHRPHLAMAFIDSQDGIASAEQDAMLLAECATERSLALRDLDDPQRASSALRAARSHVAAVPTAALRERVQSNIDFIAGTVDLRSQPRQAAVALTSAIDTWRRYGWHVHSATALLLRGQARVAIHDVQGAEQDFRDGISEVEKERSLLVEPRFRIAYFENADDLFGRLTDLLVAQRRAADALSVAEQRRARQLLDEISDHTAAAAPLDAGALIARIPQSVALLEYAVLERGIVIWLVRGGRVSMVMSPLAPGVVATACDGLLRAIDDHDDAAARREGRVLFDALIAPVVLAGVDPDDRLLIVADGPLASMPFAALTAPDGKYLIESHAICFAASGSTFAAAQSSPVGGNGVLAVAEPYPADAPPLPQAEAEARMVAQLARNGVLRIGKSIGPSQFLEDAGRFDTVHFAGHARVSQHPGQSALLFESPGAAAGLLTVDAIAASRLPSHPLIVLSACRTATGASRRNEGMDSIAHSFLRAGARGVIATLWDVKDDDAALLFGAVHRRLADGEKPADALRAAQLALLRSHNSRERQPSAWAGCVVIGTL